MPSFVILDPLTINSDISRTAYPFLSLSSASPVLSVQCSVFTAVRSSQKRLLLWIRHPVSIRGTRRWAGRYPLCKLHSTITPHRQDTSILTWLRMASVEVSMSGPPAPGVEPTAVIGPPHWARCRVAGVDEWAVPWKFTQCGNSGELGDRVRCTVYAALPALF